MAPIARVLGAISTMKTRNRPERVMGASQRGGSPRALSAEPFGGSRTAYGSLNTMGDSTAAATWLGGKEI